MNSAETLILLMAAAILHIRHRVMEISSSADERLKNLEIARRKVLQAQRQLLLEMLANKEIDDKLMKLLELELDMEELLFVRAEIK